MSLAQRLEPFVAAGLIEEVPTRFQVLQGELEMWPAVLSTEVTAEEFYQRPWGHPWLRQPQIFLRVGLDHLRIGTGMGSRLDSVIKHLHLTYHRGMPAWDLQVVQTHPGGLEILRSRTEALLEGRPDARGDRAVARRILADPDAYHRQFLGDDGWIARAERFDYPRASDVGTLPDEHFSLVGFMDHAVRSYPERPSDVGWARLPSWLIARGTQRFREGSRSSLFGGVLS